MPLSKHFRFCLWWESFFNGGHFSTCQTRKKSTPVTFFLHMRHVFLRPGVISLRRKMTPRSIFDGGRYSSYRSGGIVNFTLSFTTNDIIAISTSQTFRYWAFIFHLCRRMTYLSLSVYDAPGFAPIFMFYFEVKAMFSRLLKHGYISGHLKSSFRSFMDHMGILLRNRNLLLAKVKWHSGTRLVKMTFKSIRLFINFIPRLTVTE